MAEKHIKLVPHDVMTSVGDKVEEGIVEASKKVEEGIKGISKKEKMATA